MTFFFISGELLQRSAFHFWGNAWGIELGVVRKKRVGCVCRRILSDYLLNLRQIIKWLLCMNINQRQLSWSRYQIAFSRVTRHS